MTKDDLKIIHYHVARLATLGLGISCINDVINSSRRKSLIWGLLSGYFMLRAKHYDDLLKDELE
jgi:hypothetical protein